MILERQKLLTIVLLCVFGFHFVSSTAQAQSRTYQFGSDGSHPLVAWGGLLGSMGTYDLVGTLNLHMDGSTAWFSDINLTLHGDAGPFLKLNGQVLPMYHDLTSMTGTMIDDTTLHFEVPAAPVSCDDPGSCTFPSFNASKYTQIDITLDGSKLHLSATSGVARWLDVPSYEIAGAVGTLITSPESSVVLPEPSSGLLLILGTVVAAAWRSRGSLGQ